MKTLTRLALASSLILLFATRALSFTPGACQADEEKFCKGVPLLGIKECMKKNLEKLSDACKANILDLAIQEKEKKSGKY